MGKHGQTDANGVLWWKSHSWYSCLMLSLSTGPARTLLVFIISAIEKNLPRDSQKQVLRAALLPAKSVWRQTHRQQTNGRHENEETCKKSKSVGRCRLSLFHWPWWNLQVELTVCNPTVQPQILHTPKAITVITALSSSLTRQLCHVVTGCHRSITFSFWLI